MKLLAMHAPKDTIEWLLGRPVDSVAPLMSELPKHPTRPDFLFALDPVVTDTVDQWPKDCKAVHFEWQDTGFSHLPVGLRMIGYAVDFYRLCPDGELEQVVLVLSRDQGEVPSSFFKAHTQHHFRVVYLPDTDPTLLLANPYLAPLAVLAKCASPNPEENLAKVATVIEAQPPELAAFLSPIAQILASKIFDKNIIRTYFSRMQIRDFPLAQELIREGIDKGRIEGVDTGIKLGLAQSVLNVLEARFGALPESLLAPIRACDDSEVLSRVLVVAATTSSAAEVLAALPTK
jgi:predicted transposase YdaD